MRLLPREVLDGLRESAARLPPRPPLEDLLAGGETAANLAFFAYEKSKLYLCTIIYFFIFNCLSITLCDNVIFMVAIGVYILHRIVSSFIIIIFPPPP